MEISRSQITTDGKTKRKKQLSITKKKAANGQQVPRDPQMKNVPCGLLAPEIILSKIIYSFAIPSTFQVHPGPYHHHYH